MEDASVGCGAVFLRAWRCAADLRALRRWSCRQGLAGPFPGRGLIRDPPGRMRYLITSTR